MPARRFRQDVKPQADFNLVLGVHPKSFSAKAEKTDGRWPSVIATDF
jgi:hypothetical protein